MAQPKTGFDKYLDAQMQEPEFRAEYERARAEIDATDKLVRALDAARENAGVTKADLARQIETRPEVVRRLFTAEDPNPTVDTVLRVATALGYHLELVPNKVRQGRKTAPTIHAARRVRR